MCALKDAASAYLRSASANGAKVVLATTKQGSVKPGISFDAYYGMENGSSVRPICSQIKENYKPLWMWKQSFDRAGLSALRWSQYIVYLHSASSRVYNAVG